MSNEPETRLDSLTLAGNENLEGIRTLDGDGKDIGSALDGKTSGTVEKNKIAAGIDEKNETAPGTEDWDRRTSDGGTSPERETKAVYPLETSAYSDGALGNTPESEKDLDPLDPAAYPEGGLRAWLVVFSSFLIQFILIGFRDSFGVLQRYWVFNETFPGSNNVSISFIGTVGACGFALFGPPAGRIADRWGYQKTAALGGLVVAAGFIIGSFGTELYQLYLSLSLFFMVGLPLAYYPAVSAPQTYFLRRRSLAFGISVAGSGLGGFAITNILQKLIDSVGWRNALRIIGAVGGVCVILVALLLKPRLVASKRGAPYQWHFFRDPNFLKLFFLQFFAGLGFYIPAYYVPSFGSNIGVPPATSSFILSIQSISSFCGRLSIPMIGNFTGQFNIFLFALAIQGIAVVGILAPAQTAAQMYGFVVVYGYFSGGYTSTGTMVIADVLGISDLSTKLGHVFLAILPGQLAGPSIAGALIDRTTVILPDGTRQSSYWGAFIFAAVMLFPMSWLFVLWLRMDRAKGKIVARV
ncbi:major facilitator superfamily domain-containing protein [Hyaloraphidium curvatum]|nr:major facilitator superfamily domain-containing protein [Hyaloraphidium curvatum]